MIDCVYVYVLKSNESSCEGELEISRVIGILIRLPPLVAVRKVFDLDFTVCIFIKKIYLVVRLYTDIFFQEI